MYLRDLTDAIRTKMMEELANDLKRGRFYISRRLNEVGSVEWPNHLEDALKSGSPESLAESLLIHGALRGSESAIQGGGTAAEHKALVRAAETLAEGEFNRYYMRGVCLQAIARGSLVEVYRAKAVATPRTGSKQRVGTRIDASRLLDDLRSSVGANTDLGLPAGPNSGLSVCLVD